MPRLIDLTLTLSKGMRGVDWESARTIEKDGWNARLLQLYSHAGTHIDAATHFAAGTETIDQIPLERLIRPAWVADIPNAQAGQVLTPEDLADAELSIAPGDGLLLRTGWSEYADNPGLYRQGLPRIGEPLARWCVEKQVGLIGVEPPSVANVSDRAEVTLIHRILLENGIVIVEGLAHLAELREPKVLFGALPLKIEGGDGAPCRAFAIEGFGGHYVWH